MSKYYNKELSNEIHAVYGGRQSGKSYYEFNKLKSRIEELEEENKRLKEENKRLKEDKKIEKIDISGLCNTEITLKYFHKINEIIDKINGDEKDEN